jgi:hypothetical protein
MTAIIGIITIICQSITHTTNSGQKSFLCGDGIYAMRAIPIYTQLSSGIGGYHHLFGFDDNSFPPHD